MTLYAVLVRSRQGLHPLSHPAILALLSISSMPCGDIKLRLKGVPGKEHFLRIDVR